MIRHLAPALALALAVTSGIGLSTGCMGSSNKPVKTPKPKPGPKGKAGDPSDPALYDKAGEHTVEVELGKQKVPVAMYVPSKRKSKTLLVVVHGSNNTGPSAFKKMNMGRFHESKGVVVMAPTAAVFEESGRTRWNSGYMDLERDDLSLLENLAAAARKSGKIDRVVAVGFSNGAQMSNRWACEGTQLDALVTGAGTLAVPPSNCKRSIPNRTYVGSDDFRVQKSPAPDGSVPSVRDTMELWRKINNCKDTEPTTEKKGKRVCHTWDCKTPTSMCIVKGLGHKYPTSDNSGVDANAEAWSFLDLE